MDENFVTARNTMVHTAGGTMISAGGAVDDTITDLGTLVIVGEPDDVEEMDTMKSECVCMSVCMCVCVCERERERERDRVSECLYVCIHNIDLCVHCVCLICVFIIIRY